MLHVLRIKLKNIPDGSNSGLESFHSTPLIENNPSFFFPLLNVVCSSIYNRVIDNQDACCNFIQTSERQTSEAFLFLAVKKVYIEELEDFG